MARMSFVEDIERRPVAMTLTEVVGLVAEPGGKTCRL